MFKEKMDVNKINKEYKEMVNAISLYENKMQLIVEESL